MTIYLTVLAGHFLCGFVINLTGVSLPGIIRTFRLSSQRSIGRLLDSSVTVLRLVFSGIMERHPGLKIVQTHAGALLPYQAGRIDKNARIEGLPRPPSEYLKRIFVDTVAPQELTIRTAVDFYGADKILYGTDHPCWSPHAARDVIVEAGLNEADRTRVMSTNAEAAFDLS